MPAAIARFITRVLSRTPPTEPDAFEKFYHIAMRIEREVKRALRKLNMGRVGDDFYVDHRGRPQWDEPEREGDSRARLAHAKVLLHDVNFNNVLRKLNFDCRLGWHKKLYVCVSEGYLPGSMDVDVHCDDIEGYIAEICA